MKNITRFLFLVVTLMFTTEIMAQSTVTGTIIDAELNAPLPSANIVEKGTTNGVSSDFDGNFTITTESNSGEIVVSYVGYTSMTLSFDGNTNLGEITLNSDGSLDEVVIIGTGVIDLAEDRKTPVAVSTIRRAEIQAKSVGNVEVTEIIKGTPSVFVSPGGGGFGDSALFLRGFDDTNTAVLLNGQPVNSQEDGRIFWSNWQGVADVANAVQVQRGLGASKLAISSVGGTVNIVMKAADKTQGGSVRFLTGNDSYFKGTAEYNTGVNEKGWAFSVLFDHWQGHRKWADGTFGQGQTYFISAGYKPNDTHAFNFLITGAPQFHGQRWSQSLETIKDDPKFNQHWGYTSGGGAGFYDSEIDSERRNFYHKPVTNLNWDWTISDKSELSSVIYASWGRGGGTGPRGNRIRTSDGQLDYFGIEQANAAIGTGGFDSSETGYIRRSSMNNHAWYGLVSNFSHDFTENLAFNVGTDIRFYKGDHFRQIADLYGLDGWAEDGQVYTDTFEADPWKSLFNFADEDQRIDYDYSERINYQGLFAQVEYATDNFSAFFQGAFSNQSFEREGRHISEDEPGQKSDKLNKTGYNVKGGLSYAIDSSNKFYVNAGYYSRQPFLDNIFVDIRRSNDLVENPEVDNEDITGLEAGWEFKIGENFNGIFNAYYTNWDNRSSAAGGGLNNNGTPSDPSDDFETNTVQRGIQQVHKGFEFDMLYRPCQGIRLNGFLSAGSYEFEGASSFDEFNDVTGELVDSQTGINRDGTKIPGIPQFTAGFGASADIIAGLSVDGNIKYYGENNLHDGSSLQSENVGKIKPFSLTDLGLTYKFSLGENDLIFRGNVYNVFDEVRARNSDRFGFFNTNGMTFNSSLRYTF